MPVLAEAALPANTLRRVEVRSTPVLLARRGEQVYALAETCSYLSGPLAKGRLEGESVVCPWHGLRFALQDGRVLNGPATHPQSCFATRVRDGQIEVCPSLIDRTLTRGSLRHTSVAPTLPGSVSSELAPIGSEVRFHRKF